MIFGTAEQEALGPNGDGAVAADPRKEPAMGAGGGARARGARADGAPPGGRVSWKEVAEVMGEGVGGNAAQKRRAAGLRKRYERIKARLAEQLDA